MRQDPTPQETPPMLERLAYRVKEAADVLAISRSRFYELVAEGKIQTLKDGVRTLVRRSELEAYLDRLEADAPKPKRRPRKRLPNRP